MSMQGSYPMNGRQLQNADTVTGVVTGATADIPLSLLAAFVQIGGTPSGPTSGRPVPTFVGQMYVDTDLKLPIWCIQLSPAIWIAASGVAV